MFLTFKNTLKDLKINSKHCYGVTLFELVWTSTVIALRLIETIKLKSFWWKKSLLVRGNRNETRMAKDGKDWNWFQSTELRKYEHVVGHMELHAPWITHMGNYMSHTYIRVGWTLKWKKKLISGNVVNAETDEEKKQRNVFHRTKLLVVLPYLNNCDIFRPELNAINAILCAYSSRFHVTCHVFWKVWHKTWRGWNLLHWSRWNPLPVHPELSAHGGACRPRW